MSIQQLGTLKVGVSSASVTVSTDVFAATYKRSYNLVEKPANFGTNRITQVAGSFQDELVVSYEASNGAAASAGPALDQIVQYAVFSGTQTLYFEFTPDVTGQKVTGTMTVAEYEMGGAAGELRRREQTFPVLTSTIS